MIELPAGLASWASALAVLPSDLALALAPWVGRLAVAVGPHAPRPSWRDGEPDGYRGLARRGSYERLVSAEWAVLELSPDEFLRRAASGEHLFLQLARREPQGATRCITLVSAGPSQLGAPRLAHVAALIVLARRASSAGAGFAWGLLEDPNRRLHEALDEASILRLLGARTAVAAEPDVFERWVEQLGCPPNSDLWFIGGEDDASQAARAGASSLVVRDVLEPNTRALEVSIERRGPAAHVRLELPPPDLCARLLRDPWSRGGRRAPRSVTAVGGGREVRFAPGARRLIVRLIDGSLESWPIPSSPREQVGNRRAWAPPPDHQIVAVGIGRRSILAATVTRDDPTALELQYGKNHGVRVTLPGEASALLAECLGANETPTVGTCALVRLPEHRRTDLMLDVLGCLLVVPGFSLWPAPGSVLAAQPFHGAHGPRGRPAIATAFFPASFVWAEQHEDGRVHVCEATGSGNRRVAVVDAGPDPDVRFGFSLPVSKGWGAVAATLDAGHHRVAAPTMAGATLEAVVPVVGVCVRDGVPGILTRPHPYRLAWAIEGRRELLPAASSPIVAVAVCPSQPNVAWVTEVGEVVVYSMEHGAVLFRRKPESGP